jgi:hypothetical protein
MSTMDHAAAHEQIETLLLDPRRLAALDVSSAPEDVALREHVAGCAACRADLDAWRDLGAAITSALPRSAELALAATEPAELPPSLRASVLAKARAESRQPRSIEAAPASTPRAGRLVPLLAVAAALILVVGAAFLVVDQASKRGAAESEAAALNGALTAINRVLAEPGHVVVQLHQPDGTSAGSISWSRHDWVVITNALARPPAGQVYKCWLVEPDGAQLIGTMEFAGETAFWASSVDKWATWEIKPTTRFVVTLEQATAGRLSSPPVLEAALGA